MTEDITISEELSTAIASSWENGNYTSAISQAVIYLSDLIRDRADCDGDGMALVKRAFGGDSPKIRINRYESETDRSEHEGFMALVRGLYLAIRNPRVHDPSVDDKQTAIQMLGFIDWICGRVRSSEGKLSQEEFIREVSDGDFVDTEKYAEAIWTRVPQRARFDYLLALYARRLQFYVTTRPLVRMFESWYETASSSQTSSLLEAISRDLRAVDSDVERKTILQLIKPEMWPNIETTARLRTEHRILKSIGEVRQAEHGKTSGGSLAASSTHIYPVFSSSSELIEAVGGKIMSDVEAQVNFALNFLLDEVWPLFTAQDAELLRTAADTDDFLSYKDFPAHVLVRIREGSQMFVKLVRRTKRAMPEYMWALFSEAVENFVADPEADLPPQKDLGPSMH